MSLARVCSLGTSPLIANVLKTSINSPLPIKVQPSRLFVKYTRSARVGAVTKPAGESSAILIGKGAACASGVVGLGALCYYGLGFSPETGIIDRVGLWPGYVKDRIKTTYMYFGGTLLATAASSVMLARSPAIAALTMQQGWIALIGTFAALILSQQLVIRTPYQDTVKKHMAWLLHSGVVGAVLIPFSQLGGPIVWRAAWCTAGMVAALSTVAVCAPSEKFLQMATPLAAGCGLIIAASAATWILPPTTPLGLSFYSIAIYGGLILCSLCLLHNTQKIAYRAQEYPYHSPMYDTYDPINNALSVYTDTINIFMRLATISAMNKRSK